jgi:thiosulfate reductase/polysulfide reductase chain A
VAKTKLTISRRSFLKSSLFGALALAINNRSVRPLADELVRLGLPLPWYKKGQVKISYNYCDMCPWRCGIVVKSVDGRVYKIDGNPLDPKSRGMLCARGQAGVSFVYDPDRLRAPMIRTGERGAGEFKEVTWTEALDAAAEKLAAIRDQYGPESVAVLGHTSGDFWFTDYFAQAWGTPNAAKPSSSLCTSPREEAALITLGQPIGGHEPVDWDHVECVVLIGTHIGEDARNTMMQDFANARARGAKVIVVDPRFSTAAMKADAWLPIKPGTDTALLLAWAHVLIQESLFDQDFVDEWTVGFDELAAHVADFTPEWAAQITDLSPEQIRETARLMGRHRPRSVIVPGRHVVWYGNDTQRMRAVYIINALLGTYGRPGGLYLGKSPFIEAYPHPPFAVAGSSGGCSAEPGQESAELPTGPSGKARADGARVKFLRGPTAMQELIEPMITGEPYPIKGLIVYGTNLLHTIPNPERTKEALKKLDFVLVIDVLPMDHVAWADVVLPEATYLERYDELWTCRHKTPYIALREPAVSPLYDTKPAWWMVRELGLRLGLDAYFAWADAEEYLETRLASIGSSLEKIRESGGVIVQKGKPYLEDYQGKSPFATPSGKIELYSEALAITGHAPLPAYEPVEEPPPGYFRLVYGRHPVHTFGKTQNTPLLHELFPENAVWINAAQAAALGLQPNEYVWLENDEGVRSGPIRVKATQRIRPDVVYMVHGFGHEAPGMRLANGRGASDAQLQSRYKLDPICGGAGLRVNFVRLVKEA